jgi:co-chaperonin GroES (HSP10)
MIPFTNRLLIEPIASDAAIVTTENRFQQMGKVIAVGHRPWYKFWQPRFFKVGDTVVFNTWGADRAELNGKEYWFILENPDFILARISDSEVWAKDQHAVGQ